MNDPNAPLKRTLIELYYGHTVSRRDRVSKHDTLQAVDESNWLDHYYSHLITALLPLTLRTTHLRMNEFLE
jgi:hypothetical protein